MFYGRLRRPADADPCVLFLPRQRRHHQSYWVAVEELKLSYRSKGSWQTRVLACYHNTS